MIRIFPALADHTLRSEIQNTRRALPAHQMLETIEVMIDIDTLKAKSPIFPTPPIRQKSLMRFGRTTYTDDVDIVLEKPRDEAGAGERVAANY